MARSSWLSVTPEPELELPVAVATMRAGGPPHAEAVVLERERMERLVVRGTERTWLAYMADVVDLIERTEDDERVGHAREVALQVVHNHHQLLLGLPGRADELTAEDRARLEHMARGER